MKSIALICKFSWIGISTSVINTAVFWESKGYLVDVYCEKPDICKFPLPKFEKNSINYIITNINKKLILDDYYFRIHYFNKKKYEWVIGFDYDGIIRAGIASFGSKSRIIYHSLEFFEPEKLSIKNKLIRSLEKFFSGRASYIFTQDNQRKEFLSKSLEQDLKKIRIVYNSPIGGVITDFDDYFRNNFGISKTNKIVLCVGSLISEHCVLELVKSVETWNEKFVLVLHGWFPQKEIKEFVLEKSKQYPHRIFISEKLFPEEQKHIPFMACDIGFVGFNPTNNNLKFAAGSSGKLFDFMRTGKPILAYNTLGMVELIDNNRIGKSFTNFDEINGYILSIDRNYNDMNLACYKVFLKYEFNVQYNKIISSF